MSISDSISDTSYHAIKDGEIVYSGAMANVVPYIAKKRASGLHVKCGADGITAAVKEQRSRDLENCVETYVVGFRLEDVNGPRALYLPGVFATEEAAQQHRTEALGDPDGTNYSILPVNWRGALL